MRELVKKQIVRNFQAGLDELNTSLINWARETDSNKPQLIDSLYLSDDTEWPVKKNPDFDIQKFVDSLTDEELLVVLDSQASQNYR